MLMMKELPYDAYGSLNEIFGDERIKLFREKFDNNCFEVADIIKGIMNQNGIIAEIITFKNGNSFMDGGIEVHGRTYTHHTVVLMGEWVIDVLHTSEIIKTKDYILELHKNNPELRIDYTMSTCWYTDEGFPYKPTIDYLLEYKY